MGKTKINSALVKKVVLIAIAALVVVLLVVSIIKSFSNYRHTTSQSRDLETSIPVGQYQTYVKKLLRPSYSDKGIKNMELESDSNQALLQEMKVTKKEFTNIVINGNDLQNGTWDSENNEYVNLDPSYETNWPSSPRDKEKYDEYLNGDTGVLTSESGAVSTKVNIPVTGFYYLKLKYFIPQGKGSNVEKAFKINGKSLFEDLDDFKFYRLYHDSGEIKQDVKGNDLKPSQVEIYSYRETFIQDNSGYVIEPYLIYMEAGENEIAIEGIRDTLLITQLEICNVDTYNVMPYEDYYDYYTNLTGLDENSVTGVLDKYEAEDSKIRSASSPTLYPSTDRTSANNYPVDPVKTKYNCVGGSKWSTVGDAIYWEVEVEEDGFYNLAFRAKQDLSRGLFSTRKLLVDGVVPFSEANNCRFYYNSNYSIVTIGNEDQVFYIYLTKGVHQLALQASLGDYGASLSKVQAVIDDLNSLYLQIIIITSANPDKYQTYNLYGDNSVIPGDTSGTYMQDIFADCAQRLYEVSAEITALTGEKSSLNNTLDKLVLQIGGWVDTNGDGELDKDYGGFATNPRNVTKDLANFKTNLSSLGTWMLDIQEQTLTVESFYIYTKDQKLPRAEASFFKSTWFGIRGFFGSFFFDYQAIGITNEGGFKREIEVWFLTSGDSGREQANVVKSLIDQYFIYDTTENKDYECNVILKVLAPGVLLPATLAGTGPDVAINVDGGLPVNYALRGAIYDMAQQPDFEEAVLERFTLAGSGITSVKDVNVMVPFEMNGGYYGFPNTISYLVMFYRKDIFLENNWEVPTTWDGVIDLVTELQVSNLSFYLPLEGAGSQIFATILYQMGGQFYTDDHTACDFSTEVAKKAFEQWCSYFCDYSFELAASFTNRFRSGEMPIGITSFTLYNTLAVFAPDIAGKWAFAPLPGYVDEYGNINNKGALGSSAIVIMNQAKDKDASWDFVKFWTSTDIQTKFSQEIESILGSGARHNTANINAMQNLAWSRDEIEILTSQFQNAFGVPEVPGGYYIGRNLENAIREVINNDSDERETLAEYVELINSEITRKREEFKDRLS